MSKIKMAVFGLNQGARIARLFKENDEVELTAVAGFGQQAIDVANEVGAKLYEDYNDLLANETLDGVAIALPNSLHLSATKACCEAGIKNILLEKPIANTPEEGRAIIDCCNEHNATLLIGHHRRSSNLFLFLKEFLATGNLETSLAFRAVLRSQKKSTTGMQNGIKSLRGPSCWSMPFTTSTI